MSLNNIIMTNPEEAGGFCGMLIDLDLAVVVTKSGMNERSEAQMITGTTQSWPSKFLRMLIIPTDTTLNLFSTYSYGFVTATAGTILTNEGPFHSVVGMPMAFHESL